jgi:hypothetical protein
MKYYLVEAYSPDFKFEHNDAIVALTPLASYELDKAGIKYSILEDYHDEAEFLREEEAYFNDQLTWFDKFDKFLFDIFPEAKIKSLKLATSHHYYIKKMIDTIILRCKVINIFINKVKPNSITYINAAYGKCSISPLQFREEQSLFSRILPLFCKKYNIDFRRIILKNLLNPNRIVFGDQNFTDSAKSALKNNQIIRYLWHFYQTVSINNMFSNSAGKKNHNIFFLKTNKYIREIMKDAQKEKYGIFYKQDNKIIKQSSMYHKVIKSISPNRTPKSGKSANNLNLTNETDIIKWINSYCSIDVSEIILPKLRYFINEFCPDLIFLIDKYVDFYNSNHIDFVLTPHMVEVDECAAVIAAGYAKDTRSICLQHGDEAFALTLWDYGEYLPYDIYFTTNNEREEYIKHRIQLRKFNTKVFQYPNRFGILSKVNSLKKKETNQLLQKTVVYVPTMYTWDNTFWSEDRMPVTWYFNWHKYLIKFFSSRDDFNFVWKGLPTIASTYDPIPDMINDRKYKNIKYATNPFVEWIKKADMVLLDFPSTALYEAAASGLPVMSLFFAPHTVIRESALSLFGRSLQSFNSFDEGIAKIEDFLNSDPEEFVVSIPHSEISVLETISSIIN